MGYIELNVKYLLDERQQKALEELLPKWQQYEDKAGEKPFADITLPKMFNNIMTIGGKYDISTRIKNEQYRQGIIDSSELIGNGEFLLSEERKVVHDRLQQMTLEEKVDFLEEYENMKSKDPLEKAISPMDVRLHEILSKDRCEKIWKDIRMVGLKPSHTLVNAIGRLDALTGKENNLWEVKRLTKAKDVSPEVTEVLNEIVQEMERQEEEAFRQCRQKEEIRCHQKIRTDIRANGFKATTTLVAKIESLATLTGKINKLSDIKEMAKTKDMSPEIKETVNGIVDELQRQELKMQAPEPPVVEPTM